MKWLFSDVYENHPNWILYENSDKRVLRSRYKRFQCPKCKKVDEFLSIKSGIDQDVIVKFKTSVSRSYDGLICISQEVFDLFSRLEVKGVLPLEIPNGGKYVLLPKKTIEVLDLANSGMRLLKPCGVCNRPRECKMWPSIRSLRLPHRGMDIAILDPSPESHYNRQCLFMLSDSLALELQLAKVSGVKLRDVT